MVQVYGDVCQEKFRIPGQRGINKNRIDMRYKALELLAGG